MINLDQPKDTSPILPSPLFRINEIKPKNPDKNYIVKITSDQWTYFNEGNLHMCFESNNKSNKNYFSDMILKVEKEY